MNKITTFLTTIPCLILLLTGCQSAVDRGIGGTQQGPNRLRVNYTVKSTNAGGTTRASIAPELGEDSVKTMKMFFFEPSTDGLGTFIESYTVPEDSLVGQTTGGTIDVEFTADSKLNKSSSYVILIVANAPTALYEAGDNTFADQTETDFISTTLYEVEGVADAATYYTSPYSQAPIVQGHLVMSQRIVKAAADETLDVQLTRIMARFDISCGYGNYKLVSASVWNAAKSAQIWSGSTPFATTKTARFYGIEAITNDAHPGGFIQGGLYALENYVNTPEQNDMETTCLILGIQEGDDDQTLTYYRVNIVKEGHQYLKRNNVYQVVVSRVRGAGANTEIDALTQAEMLLDINVNGWTVDPNGSVQMDEEGNMLAVGSTNVVLPATAGSYDVTVFAVGDKELRIRIRSLPPGMDANLAGDKLHITYSATSEDRGGFVELEFGKLTATINIAQKVVAEKYLSISPSEPQIVSGAVGVQIPNKIKVSSSGTWTAKIYNNGFTFTLTSPPTNDFEETGDNNDQLFIYTATENTDVLPHAAFVLFTLDADPEITCTLVLQQRGTGGISYTPPADRLVFDTDGNVVLPGGFDKFMVTTSEENPQWEAKLSGQDAAAFTLNRTEGDQTIQDLTVTAQPNTLNRTLTANLTMQLKNRPSIFRVVQISQEQETLSISPAIISTTLPLGGGTTQAVTVTSSKDWEASIAVEHGTATLDRESGHSGETFAVTFGKNTTPNVVPTATVTVKISGTEVQQQLIVKQDKLIPKPVKLRNHYNGYGNYVGNDNSQCVRYFYEYLTNTGYFGPGTNSITPLVYTSTPITISSASTTATLGRPNITNDINIYWENVSFDANYIGEAITWKNANPEAVLVVLPGTYCGQASTLLNSVTTPGAYGSVTDGNLTANEKFNVTDAKAWCVNRERGSKLWAYLQNGPFGTITDDQLSSIIYDTYWRAYSESGLSSWPSTMVPLIMKNGCCTLGIDPTTNVVFMNGQLFNQYPWGNPSEGLQNNQFTVDSPNGIFFGNLLAFIVNSAQYGFNFSKAYAD